MTEMPPEPQPARRRTRRRLVPFLVLAIVLAEFWVIIQVGSTIGVGWTILALVADTFVGAWLVKIEGRRALAQFLQASREGGLASKEIANGFLVLLGGLLILLPGFLLDVVGLLLVLPFTRPLLRGPVTRTVEARTLAGFASAVPGFGDAADAPRPRPPGTGPVVEGEVVDDD